MRASCGQRSPCAAATLARAASTRAWAASTLGCSAITVSGSGQTTLPALVSVAGGRAVSALEASGAIANSEAGKPTSTASLTRASWACACSRKSASWVLRASTSARSTSLEVKRPSPKLALVKDNARCAWTIVSC
ncbi:hypothetical protein D3C86_1855070 [compost metagenome]